VREPGSVSVSGRVTESPACAGAVWAATVTLEPLGWTVLTEPFGGHFSFGGVAPGDYTLTVTPPCNGSGCWAPRPIHVESDVELDLCPERTRPVCAGDCDDDGRVLVHEVIGGIAIALGTDDLAACPRADSDASGAVAIDDLTRAVGGALRGCPEG
jgi:hypothetical protein